MKLQALSAKPKLTQILIDDTDTVEKYGEVIEFYIYDRYSMDLYMKLSSIEDLNDAGAMQAIAYDIMLDENGNKIMADGHQLPVDLQIKAVEKTLISLGNSMTQTSPK
jgi:hypothetical protein